MGTHDMDSEDEDYENKHWIVIWHVNDHAEYESFEEEALAWDKFQSLDNGRWATRIHTPEGHLQEQYGAMCEEDWGLLDQVVEEVVAGTRPLIVKPDGAAVRVAWGRSISAEDVASALSQLREMWPHTQIVIGSGV